VGPLAAHLSQMSSGRPGFHAEMLTEDGARARKKPEKGGEDEACRCGHIKSLHLERWRDESVANKCERCPDSEPCQGYVPSAPREQPAPSAQPPERREKKRSPTRERKEAPRSPRPAVRPGRKSRPSGRSVRRGR
jgi:hypothetical protein